MGAITLQTVVPPVNVVALTDSEFSSLSSSEIKENTLYLIIEES